MSRRTPISPAPRPPGTFAAVWLLMVSAMLASPPRKSFDLPSDVAARTLKLFAEQAGVEVLISASLGRDIRTRPVKGDFTPREALDLMLNQTGLAAKEDAETGTMAILRAAKGGGKAASPEPAAQADSSKKKPTTPNPEPRSTLKRNSPISLLFGWLALAVAPTHTVAAVSTSNPAAAPSELSHGPGSGAPSGAVATGTVDGRVFNPATAEFLRNAEISVRGTALLAVTDSEGRYRLSGVPAGSVTLVVRYAGYPTATSSVTISPGAFETLNFEMQETASGQTEVVQLGRITVAGEREGTSKALMEQRAAMNIKNVISSDTFGDMIEGNIGEVLQFLPGIEVEYSGADPSSFRLRGMDSDYGALMVDGIRVPSGTLNGSREPELAVYGANGMDTIEVNKSNSAAMDADAPAGSVNMRSKSAFQRKGRHIGLQAYALFNSLQPTLGKSNGPNDGEMNKTLPGVTLEYSDVFLNDRLGMVVNLSDVMSSNDQAGVDFTYNTVPTAASPEPVVLTSIAYLNGPKINRRQSGGINLQYKVGPSFTVALRGQFNVEDVQIFNRQFSLTSNRANLAPGSNAMLMIANPTTNNATRFNIGGNHTYRGRNNHSIVPNLIYEGRRLRADATFAFSRAGQVAKNGRADSDSPSLRAANMVLYGMGFVAQRVGDVGDTRVQFRQTSGPDLYDLANWRGTSGTNNMTRTPTEPRTRSIVGQLNAQYETEWPVATTLRAGVKFTENSYYRIGGNYSYTYVGATGNRLTAEIPVTPYWFDPVVENNLFTDRKIPFPDRLALGKLMQSNPEYFTPNPANATNEANVYPERFAKENIDAGYLMATARLRALTLEAGIRYEGTQSRASVFEQGQLRNREGSYDNTFLSGAARYRFSDNFMAIAAFNQSIRRNALVNMTGIATVNEETLSGTIPNLELRPEHGKNYSARLEYYLKPLGLVTAGVFQMDVTDLHVTATLPAEEIGLGDEYPGYLFSTTTNHDKARIQGFELEYRQQLTFLPAFLSGFGVFANYTKNDYGDPAAAVGKPEDITSGGISFRRNRLATALRAVWRGRNVPNETTVGISRTHMSMTLDYRISKHWTGFIAGRNILNAPIYGYSRPLVGHLTVFRTYGANWTLGVKSQF